MGKVQAPVYYMNATHISKLPPDERHVVNASKEVILSAGSIGSPHILLNSGIGDQASLNAVGVPSTVHLPDVGRNLSDQVSCCTLPLHKRDKC